MNTIYRISEDDYLKANKLFARLTSRQLIVYSLIVLIILGFAVFGFGVIKQAAIIGLCVGFMIYLVGNYIVSPILGRSHYRKYKAIQDEFEIDLFDDGVFIGSASGSGKVVWSNIYKWRQDENYILIFLMPRLYYIIPKSINASGFNISLLVKQLNHHVGDSA